MSLSPPSGGQWQASGCALPDLGPLPAKRCLCLETKLNSCPAPAPLPCPPPLPPSPAPPAVWLAYTPPAFSFDLAAHLPACCAKLAQQYLQFNGSFFLAAGYSLYYLLLEPLAGLTWAGNGCFQPGW